MFLLFTGIPYSFGQTDAAPEVSKTATKNGSLLAIHCHDTYLANVVFLVGCPLVGLCVVCNRREGARDA